MWYGTKVKYHKKVNRVHEKTIAKFETYVEAVEWLVKHKKSPVYIWAKNAVDLYNPSMAMIETSACKKEHQKIIEY